MANINRLKAWVRYDGKGRLVGGGPILQESKPKNGDWVEIPYDLCCQPTTSTTTTAQSLALRLLFNDIENANALVGDASNVANWNTFFNLPLNGNPFISVTIVDNEIKLYGGSNIIISESLFSSNVNILSVYDDSGSVVELGITAFEYTTNLTSISFPAVTFIGEYCFQVCTSLVYIYIPACIQLGQEVTDNGIFDSIVGNTISLTVNSIVMTCNGGLPDGDIQYLQANNTVTIVTV